MVDRNFVLRLRNLAGNEVCRVAVPLPLGHESPDELQRRRGPAAAKAAKLQRMREDRAAAKAWRYSVFTAVERVTRAGPHSQRYGDIITAEPLKLEELQTTADIRRALQLDAFDASGEGGAEAEDRFTTEGIGNDVLVEGIYVTVDQVAREEEERVALDPGDFLSRLEVRDWERIYNGPDPWESDTMEIMRAVLARQVFPPWFYRWCVSERLWDTEEIATVALGQHGLALRYASERLRDSEEVAGVAVGQGGLALQYASERLRDSEQVAGLAVGKDGLALQYASERLRDSEQVARLAVGKNGIALGFVSERLRDSAEVVGVAVGQIGWALEYASERLRDSEEVAGVAVGKNGRALFHVSERLLDDEEFVRFAVGQRDQWGHPCPWLIEYASQRLRDKIAGEQVSPSNLPSEVNS